MRDSPDTPNLSFSPALPARRLGELKDLAQEVAVTSSDLEGQLANSTAKALGDCLRYLNSYYSNLIEGHKTSILEIEDALNKKFSQDGERRYAQELCEEKSERQARRIVSQLASEGLIQSDSHRAPLRIAFPTHVLRLYFPDLFDPSVLGEPNQGI